MRPNVLCVGFTKCGTTTLYDIMKQHPDIYLSGIKEPIYYGRQKLMEDKGFEWYQNRYYPKKINKKVVMEINPIIARNASAANIKLDYGSDVKIIFIVRNPVDRLYSEFKMNLLDGTCFTELSDNLGDSTSKLFDKWIKINFVKNNKQYILNDNPTTKFCDSGNYYTKIKDYIETFGDKNIQIVFFEDFIREPEKECSKIFDFIGIELNNSINYKLHSNDGNRLPKSILTMKINKIWFTKIYRQFLIEKVPFISNNMCKFINYLTWKVPVLFSKQNLKPDNMSDNAKMVIYNYYYDMIENLCKLMNEDLFEKWGIEEKKMVLKNYK